VAKLGRIFVIVWFAAFMLSAARAADPTTAVWSDGHTSALSDAELTRYATASPGAGYPEEAQKNNLTGSGLYELQINKSGATTAVAIVRTSGSAVLDKAATGAFRKWRFKPAVFRSVRIPVSWSVNRVKK
jgi:TonB family protein